jgi:ABC-type transport system involved in multi-copper enzyme maturation permease subunit
MKKVFVKVSNKIAIILLLVVLGIVCYLSITGVKFVNEEGKTEIGFGAINELKKEKHEWTGELTEEKIAKVIAENKRINETDEYQSEDVKKNNIAYGWKQGISDIRSLLIYSYGEFREYDYYLPDSLTVEDAGNFYKNRVLNLQEWLDTESSNQFTEDEKEFLVHQYKSLEIPLYYEYADGWKQLFENAPTILMIMVFVLGFLVSNVFSSEAQLKADAIFYSSRYGRSKAILAKIKAGILITTIIYWIVMMSYSLILFGVLGFDGANCAIQTSMAGWKSFYNITYLQEYIIVIVGGYIGTVFIMMLTMLVSAQTKSAVLAVIVPFILVFIPSFLSGNSNNILAKLLGLLPDQLLQMNVTLAYFNLYNIGNRIIGACEILFLIYPVGSAILYPLIYYINKKIAKK